jgi:hypothetical protein
LNLCKAKNSTPNYCPSRLRQLAPLFNQVDAEISRVTADGTYDEAPTYALIAAHVGDIA